MNHPSQDEERQSLYDPYTYELSYRDSSPDSIDRDREILPFPLRKPQQQPLSRQQRKSRVISFTLYTSLYTLSNLCYLLALWPAPTPRIMNRRLGKIGALIVVSVVLFSAQLWLAFRSRRASPRIWFGSCLLQVGTVAAWYCYDSGNVLSSHGAYNLLIFSLIFVPANLLIAGLYFWYNAVVGNGKGRPSKFWKQLVAVVIIGGLLFSYVASGKKEGLKYGFFGKEMPCSRSEREEGTCGSCQWDEGTPWFDLLPVRQNIFIGPMTCPNDTSFSASFEGNKLVVEGCGNQQTDFRSYFNNSVIHSHAGPMYSLLPRTEAWGRGPKNDSLDRPTSGLQDSVLKYVEANTFPYTPTTEIPPETDSVFVHCGTHQPKLAYRILPISPIDTSKKVAALPPNNSGLNVVTLFIDAMSRNHFHRRLPLTRKVLEDLQTSSNSQSKLYEFFRYHSVGMNTGPNTRAMWTSLPSELETPSVSTSTNTTTTSPIWEQFEASGYISARIDPMCQDWNAYYNPSAFPTSPESLQTIPPRISHEHLAYSCLPPILPIGKSKTGNFAGPLSIMARCMSGTHVGWHVLDWAEKFISTYSPLPSSGSLAENDTTTTTTPSQTRDNQKHTQTGKATPYFLTAAFMEAHEGSGEVLSTLDSRLSSFLSPTTGPINHNNTLIMIVSDHGALMGLNNAFFENGKVEAKNPFLGVLAPRWFLEQQERGEKLEDATGRLVTGFDVYETLRGVLGRDKEEDEGERIGRDLLSERVGDRRCSQANVPEEMCRCR